MDLQTSSPVPPNITTRSQSLDEIATLVRYCTYIVEYPIVATQCVEQVDQRVSCVISVNSGSISRRALIDRLGSTYAERVGEGWLASSEWDTPIWTACCSATIGQQPCSFEHRITVYSSRRLLRRTESDNKTNLIV